MPSNAAFGDILTLCCLLGSQAMKRIAACFFMLLVAVATTPARAQSAVSCGCYCGITISPPCSEQACKAACGWRDGDSGRGGSQSGPARVWYCRALAPNGTTYGWGSSSSQDNARQRALSECQRRASGCTIDACRVNDPSLASAPRKTRPTAGRQSQTKVEQGWCGLCVRKLQSDINSGWASALIRSYVGQAIAGYENCKRRASGTCTAGDQLVNRLRACGSKMFAEYRNCISSSLH